MSENFPVIVTSRPPQLPPKRSLSSRRVALASVSVAAVLGLAGLTAVVVRNPGAAMPAFGVSKTEIDVRKWLAENVGDKNPEIILLEGPKTGLFDRRTVRLKFRYKTPFGGLAVRELMLWYNEKNADGGLSTLSADEEQLSYWRWETYQQAN